MMTTRRELMTTGGLLLLAGCAGQAAPRRDPAPDFAAVARTLGGRLGIAAIDTETGATLGFDAGARYAMCSTFKLPLVAAVLAKVDRGALSLRQPIAFTAADVLDYAPVVAAATDHVLILDQLCAAAIVYSDNSAANLLLPLVGGPAGLTAFARTQGDGVFRLDRVEPALNSNLPGDPRDTSTPVAMAALAARLLTGDALALESRARLIEWMSLSTTGAHRLKAGLPPLWKVADKTGTSGQGAVNDVAIAWPPARRPIVIACFVDAPRASAAACEAAQAEAGAIVARHFA